MLGGGSAILSGSWAKKASFYAYLGRLSNKNGREQLLNT